MPKKTAAAKKKAPAKKTATGKRRGRPPGSKNKTTAAKKTTSVKKPAGTRGGFNREINEDTGFVVGTDQDAIALALLDGGESRAEIAERLEGTLETETRNGTPKQITNMVSGVLNKMLERGFTVESSFVVVPPTAASKRAATRAANARKSAPAKKTAAKKTPAKRGPGRPKGSKNKTAAKKTTAARSRRK